jgi:hypothetical protein
MSPKNCALGCSIASDPERLTVLRGKGKAPPPQHRTYVRCGLAATVVSMTY